MMKLDEYLEKHKFNILKAVADAFGYNCDNPADLEKAREIVSNKLMQFSNEGDQINFESELVTALEAHDRLKVLSMFDMNEVIDFNGVEISENYNFKCSCANENVKNGLMDWLEESKFEYLIDNDGKFAIKCPTRKHEYMVDRKLNHLMSKWDRGSIGSNVNHEMPKKRLPDQIKNSLVDGLNESSYPNNEAGVKQCLLNIVDHQYLGNIDDFMFMPDPEHDGVWLAANPKIPFSAVVWLNDEDFAVHDHPEQIIAKYFPGTVTEGRKNNINKLKKKLNDPKEKSKAAGGYNPANELTKGQYKSKVIPNKKKDFERKEAKKKVSIDETLNEGVLGMVSIPSIDRMLQLAGVTPTQTIEVSEIGDQDPQNCVLEQAVKQLQTSFDLYDRLTEEEKKQFKKIMANKLIDGN